MSEFDTYAGSSGWFSRNLGVLSAVSFLQDAASDLIYPVLPIFLRNTLLAPVWAIGLTEGLADAMAALSKIVAGRASDGRRKRPFIGVGYGIAALGKVIVAVAGVWPVVLLGRATDRVGKGMRGSPRDALIAGSIEPRFRGRAFGFHRSMDSAGAVVGPLLGLGAYEAFQHHIRPLLFVAIVPAVLSVLLVFAVRETAPVAVLAPDSLAVAPHLPRPFWRAVTLLSVFALFNFPDALLLLRASSLGMSLVGVILIYCLFNAVQSLLSYPAGALADHLGRNKIIALGFAIFGVTYLGLGLANRCWWVWVLFPLYGGYAALTDGVGKAWISDLVPSAAHGRALGLQQGLAGLACVIAGLWAGLLWNGDGVTPLLISGTAGVVVSIAMLILSVTDDA